MGSTALVEVELVEVVEVVMVGGEVVLLRLCSCAVFVTQLPRRVSPGAWGIGLIDEWIDR